VARTSGRGKTMVVDIPKGRSFDLIDIAESLEGGQRIRRFSVEARHGGVWREVVTGTSVGYRFLHRLVKPIQANQVRLTIEDAVGEAVVERFAVYMAED